MIGLSGSSLRFITALLADCKLRVPLGPTLGHLTLNNIDVPQRSVLSVTLFHLALAGLPF